MFHCRILQNPEFCGFEIPLEIISEIANTIDEISNLVSFSRICKATWNFYSKTKLFRFMREINLDYQMRELEYFAVIVENVHLWYQPDFSGLIEELINNKIPHFIFGN